MEDKALVILNIAFLITLLYGYYSVTVQGRMSSFTKWLIACSATAIFILTDKVFGVLAVIGILLTQTLTKRNGLKQP